MKKSKSVPTDNHGPTTSHNYQGKLFDALANGQLPMKSGKVSEVDVWHDDWCDVYSGGFCNCNPDISIRPETAQK